MNFATSFDRKSPRSKISLRGYGFVEIIAHSFEERLDGKWFRNIGFASTLPDFFGDHRNMTQMFASLRNLKSGNVGQLNIHHYEG